jgi:predicted house-cleaning noncanonical NTP pyrophosphatase (MazG superfamily)
MAAYEKLVRDNIPKILDEKGISYQKRIATSAEYKVELIKKLVEETAEFAEEGAIEEFADVLEVVAALKELPEYQNAEEVRIAKYNDRGGFKEKIILSGEK